MGSRDLVLAIDNGTQSVKAMVFDTSGTMIAVERVPFNAYFSKQPGWAEQDPELFWQCLCRACQGLWARDPDLKNRIAGLAITTQRGTTVAVDRDGNALRPAILWLDQRRIYGIEPVGGLWGLLFKVAGASRLIAHFQAEADANWLMRNEPETWKRTHKFLLLSGYLTHKLCGEFSDSVGSQVGYIPFDYRRLKWASERDWKFRAVPLNPSHLPSLVPPGQLLGHVHAKASQQTGIPEGLPLIAAAADKACEVLGSGSLAPSIGCLSYGTTATINVTHKKYVEPHRFMPPYPSAVPQHYTLEVQVYRGYWMITWFKEQFGYLERVEASRQGVEAETLFDKLIDDIPPGAMGLMLQPYWSPGLRVPGPEAKGGIIGFGDVHTRAHVYRAILEGLAYALREGKEQIEGRTGVPIRSLRVSGGGSQSRHAMQVTANVFGLPTSRPHVYETSGLGAAIDAAVGLGLHRDIEEAAKHMTHLGDVFEPDPKVHELYDALYRRVYKKMYQRLKPLYEDIRAITGYPAGPGAGAGAS